MRAEDCYQQMTQMRQMMLSGIVAVTLALAVNHARADEPSARELVQRGTQALEARQFDAAIQAFNEAAPLLPHTPELDYARGVALYQKGDLPEAARAFQEALATTSRGLEAKAKFNLGECAYGAATSAMQNGGEQAAIIDSLKSAIAYYRDALAINPADEDARIRIEAAYKLKKQIEEQQQQQPQTQPSEKPEDQQQQNQQSQPSTQPDEQSASQPSSQPSESDQQQQQREQQDQQQGEEQQDQKSEQGQQADEEKEQEQQQEAKQAKPSERELSKEEAQRLLQLIRDKEQKRRERLAELRRQRARRAPVEKDW